MDEGPLLAAGSEQGWAQSLSWRLLDLPALDATNGRDEDAELSLGNESETSEHPAALVESLLSSAVESWSSWLRPLSAARSSGSVSDAEATQHSSIRPLAWAEAALAARFLHSVVQWTLSHGLPASSTPPLRRNLREAFALLERLIRSHHQWRTATKRSPLVPLDKGWTHAAWSQALHPTLCGVAESVAAREQEDSVWQQSPPLQQEDPPHDVAADVGDKVDWNDASEASSTTELDPEVSRWVLQLWWPTTERIRATTDLGTEARETRRVEEARAEIGEGAISWETARELCRHWMNQTAGDGSNASREPQAPPSPPVAASFPSVAHNASRVRSLAAWAIVRVTSLTGTSMGVKRSGPSWSRARAWMQRWSEARRRLDAGQEHLVDEMEQANQMQANLEQSIQSMRHVSDVRSCWMKVERLRDVVQEFWLAWMSPDPPSIRRDNDEKRSLAERATQLQDSFEQWRSSLQDAESVVRRAKEEIARTETERSVAAADMSALHDRLAHLTRMLEEASEQDRGDDVDIVTSVAAVWHSDPLLTRAMQEAFESLDAASRVIWNPPDDDGNAARSPVAANRLVDVARQAIAAAERAADTAWSVAQRHAQQLEELQQRLRATHAEFRSAEQAAALNNGWEASEADIARLSAATALETAEQAFTESAGALRRGGTDEGGSSSSLSVERHIDEAVRTVEQFAACVGRGAMPLQSSDSAAPSPPSPPPSPPGAFPPQALSPASSSSYGNWVGNSASPSTTVRQGLASPSASRTAYTQRSGAAVLQKRHGNASERLERWHNRLVELTESLASDDADRRYPAIQKALEVAGARLDEAAVVVGHPDTRPPVVDAALGAAEAAVRVVERTWEHLDAALRRLRTVHGELEEHRKEADTLRTALQTAQDQLELLRDDRTSSPSSSEEASDTQGSPTTPSMRVASSSHVILRLQAAHHDGWESIAQLDDAVAQCSHAAERLEQVLPHATPTADASDSWTAGFAQLSSVDRFARKCWQLHHRASLVVRTAESVTRAAVQQRVARWGAAYDGWSAQEARQSAMDRLAAAAARLAALSSLEKMSGAFEDADSDQRTVILTQALQGIADDTASPEAWLRRCFATVERENPCASDAEVIRSDRAKDNVSVLNASFWKAKDPHHSSESDHQDDEEGEEESPPSESAEEQRRAVHSIVEEARKAVENATSALQHSASPSGGGISMGDRSASASSLSSPSWESCVRHAEACVESAVETVQRVHAHLEQRRLARLARARRIGSSLAHAKPTLLQYVRRCHSERHPRTPSVRRVWQDPERLAAFERQCGWLFSRQVQPRRRTTSGDRSRALLGRIAAVPSPATRPPPSPPRASTLMAKWRERRRHEGSPRRRHRRQFRNALKAIDAPNLTSDAVRDVLLPPPPKEELPQPRTAQQAEEKALPAGTPTPTVSFSLPRQQRSSPPTLASQAVASQQDTVPAPPRVVSSPSKEAVESTGSQQPSPERQLPVESENSSSLSETSARPLHESDLYGSQIPPVRSWRHMPDSSPTSPTRARSKGTHERPRRHPSHSRSPPPARNSIQMLSNAARASMKAVRGRGRWSARPA